LGVADSATEEDIKQAYRRLAFENHPDRNAGDADAHKRFIAINCAYEFLISGKPCGEILNQARAGAFGVPEDEKFKLDSPWGYFLWWRDRYFG